MKLETLLDIGKELPRIPAGAKGVEIKGCASRVEIYKDANGRLYGTADSAIVRGIVTLLLAMKSENIDLDEFNTFNLNLGAGRLNGAAAVIEYLKAL